MVDVAASATLNLAKAPAVLWIDEPFSGDQRFSHEHHQSSVISMIGEPAPASVAGLWDCHRRKAHHRNQRRMAAKRSLFEEKIPDRPALCVTPCQLGGQEVGSVLNLTGDAQPERRNGAGP
jgi:hypothetical protein